MREHRRAGIVMSAARCCGFRKRHMHFAAEGCVWCVGAGKEGGGAFGGLELDQTVYSICSPACCLTTYETLYLTSEKKRREGSDFIVPQLVQQQKCLDKHTNPTTVDITWG